MLRRGDDLGTVEVGKIADVLVVDSVRYDPQELLDRVTTG